MNHLKSTCAIGAIAAVSLLAGCAAWQDLTHRSDRTAYGATYGTTSATYPEYTSSSYSDYPAYGSKRPSAYPVYGSAGYSSPSASTAYPNSTATTASVTPSYREGPLYSRIDQDTIREAQECLVDKGYRPGVVDGRWGPHTRAAVLSFQRDKGLRQTAMLDHPTLLALGVEP